MQILTRDARRTGLRSGSFDLVHARNLLVNVPEPQEVVTEMVRLAWCAACARRCWRWAWPARRSSTSWMRRSVPISMTPAR